MRNYILSTPKDDHGQPIRLFKANLENNVSKAIDQLSGICSGVLADELSAKPKRDSLSITFGSSLHMNQFGHSRIFLSASNVFLPMASATMMSAKNSRL